MTVVVAQHRRRANSGATIEAVLLDLEREVTDGASFVLLPENAFTGEDGSSPSRSQTEQCQERLAALARNRRTYILTGSWLEEATNGPIQVAKLLDPTGSVHLEISRPVEEDGRTGTGEDFPVVETEFGRVGVLLGPDIWLNEPPRIQCLKGAELLLVAGSLMGSDVVSQRAAVWGIATLNTVAVALASSLSPQSRGGSAVAMPDGFRVEALDREGLFETPLDLERIRHLRTPDLRFQETLWFGLWARRPELYSTIATASEVDGFARNSASLKDTKAVTDGTTRDDPRTHTKEYR
jgi:predicted amidohydrolase